MRPAASNSKFLGSDASKRTLARASTASRSIPAPFSCSCRTTVPPPCASRFTNAPPVRTTSRSPAPTLRTVPAPKRFETTSSLPASTCSMTRPDASRRWTTAVVSVPAGAKVTVSARQKRHQPKKCGELRNEYAFSSTNKFLTSWTHVASPTSPKPAPPRPAPTLAGQFMHRNLRCRGSTACPSAESVTTSPAAGRCPSTKFAADADSVQPFHSSWLPAGRKVTSFADASADNRARGKAIVVERFMHCFSYGGSSAHIVRDDPAACQPIAGTLRNLY